LPDALSAGLRPRLSGPTFSLQDRPARCLALDIRMPGMSGLELQVKLNERHSILPIIFITGHGDVPMAVEAMQRRVDFARSHSATRTCWTGSTRRSRGPAAALLATRTHPPAHRQSHAA
jgi:CheY-like chemotaxis protein